MRTPVPGSAQLHILEIENVSPSFPAHTVKLQDHSCSSEASVKWAKC